MNKFSRIARVTALGVGLSVSAIGAKLSYETVVQTSVAEGIQYTQLMDEQISDYPNQEAISYFKEEINDTRRTRRHAAAGLIGSALAATTLVAAGLFERNHRNMARLEKRINKLGTTIADAAYGSVADAYIEGAEALEKVTEGSINPKEAALAAEALRLRALSSSVHIGEGLLPPQGPQDEL